MLLNIPENFKFTGVLFTVLTCLLNVSLNVKYIRVSGKLCNLYVLFTHTPEYLLYIFIKYARSN